MKADFPPIATLLFLATVAFLFVITILGLPRALSKTRNPNYTSILYQVALGMIAWLTLLSVLSLKGFFFDYLALPPRVMLPVLTCFIFIFILAISKKFGNLLMEFPAAWLIAPQAFRIVVEIVLWQLHKNGNAPVQMSFEGLNFDILAGISAPIIAYMAFGNGRKNYTLALVWNVISMALLINILTIAILSMPLIGAFDEPNTFVAYFPYILLPGFVAPYAMMLHVMSIKQLLKLRKARA
ncbi:MAG TPA: hypothetical protein ENJ82_09565 [Bacteroidetes bacterium]|nr:hypothetical protein [Bacteroidota bacterium]